MDWRVGSKYQYLFPPLILGEINYLHFFLLSFVHRGSATVSNLSLSPRPIEKISGRLLHRRRSVLPLLVPIEIKKQAER
ncbi:hypothetical protein KSP40_PGU005628 [Platanthera guangdongensis]|uniref:Uncharacterized protein n=1 Tax=Platanthera guangdongensis TaxID=2320717 RepID=A0ABR2MX76_9ASPA